MKAGRGLDALIEQHVFGSEIIEGVKLVTDPDGSTWFREAPLRYSTNIADAWLVVEKLLETNDVVEVLTFKTKTYVEVRKHAHITDVKTEAETAPMAICLAALKVVGVEVDG